MLLKQINIFEKTIKISVSFGMSNHSILLRRFTRFHRKGLSYFKRTSLIFKVDTNLFLLGIGLTGLYSSIRKPNDQNTRLPIILEVAEIKTKENNETFNDNKLKENNFLNGIANKYDPIYHIYFKKATILKSNTPYLIKITNTSENNYIDLWTGEVSKYYSSKMKQDIKCNCSEINFTILPSEGYESDFNEFNIGIIANLIYSSSE